MTPLQRAARSLCSRAGYDPDFDGGFVGVSGDWVEPGLPRWKEYLDDVRLVVLAIREASSPMVHQARSESHVTGDCEVDYIGIWASMIDAALEQG